MCFLKIFLWTRNMQFWQPYRKIFAKNSKIFCSKSEKNYGNITFTKQTFFIKMFLRTRRMQIWQLCPNFFTKFAVRKKLENNKSLFFQKKFFPINIPRPRQFFSKLLNNWKISAVCAERNSFFLEFLSRRNLGIIERSIPAAEILAWLTCIEKMHSIFYFFKRVMIWAILGGNAKSNNLAPTETGVLHKLVE